MIKVIVALPAACTGRRMMAREVEMSQEAKARRDHRIWLDDCGRWRSEHRAALAMLAKVQEIILEREVAMEGQAAEVQAHELELQKYDLIGIESFAPDPEKQIAANTEFTQRHRRARDTYERTDKETARQSRKGDRKIVRTVSVREVTLHGPNQTWTGRDGMN